MQKIKKKTLIRLIYIVATILIIVLIGIFDPNIINIFQALSELNIFWLITGFVCLFLYWITDSILLYHIVSYMHKKMSILKTLKISIIGLYYGALTPFATGGQPMQVIYMKRDDIPYGISTSIVSVKFIIYELSLCIFYVVAMLFRGAYFYASLNGVFWFTTLGFLINLSSVIMITFIMINKKIPYKIIYGLIRILHRIRIIKHPEKYYRAADKNIEEFHKSIQYIIKNKCKVLISILISAFNLVFLFSISYFIYLAFGHNEKSLIDLITMQSFLYLAVSFFPLPGAAVASEGGFYIFFSSYFTKVPVFIAMLVWRFMSYYSILIIGSLVVVIDEFKNITKKK